MSCGLPLHTRHEKEVFEIHQSSYSFFDTGVIAEEVKKKVLLCLCVYCCFTKCYMQFRLDSCRFIDCMERKSRGIPSGLLICSVSPALLLEFIVVLINVANFDNMDE